MQITTPDIGVDQATVAEILVKVGDTIAVDESIVLLESDKASVEVPSTSAGVVKSILVSLGDSVAEGAVLIELEAEGQVTTPVEEAPKAEEKAAPVAETKVDVAPKSVRSTSEVIDVQVPDIGVEKALVGEVLVKAGDEIEVDQSIVVVESDKATVEVPSPVAGIVESVEIKEGDSVKEGVVILKVKVAGAAETQPAQQVTQVEEAPAVSTQKPSSEKTTAPAPTGAVEVTVPDLGVDKATVSEILVKVGDTVEAQQSLCVVESDKASVEVPSSTAGVIKAIHVELGQSVSQGVALATIEVEGQTASIAEKEPTQAETQTAVAPKVDSTPANTVVVATTQTNSDSDKLTKEQNAANANVYAGPAVRKLARELGVVLAEVKASGPHQRLMKEDLVAYVKMRLTAPQTAPVVASATAVAAGLPKLPSFDAFGGVEEKALTRLQQVSIPQLSLNNYIPQVTQFDLADITELEAWRNDLKGNFKKDGISLTIMAFIIKAVAHLLKEEREFASHLADDGKSVLLRNEIHMGIAVATPDGLTVPVLRHPDQKSIKEIAIELGVLGQKARDKKLSPKDLQGANFTISSLGAIGGTAFTPLVNWPQVAILGISPATMQKV